MSDNNNVLIAGALVVGFFMLNRRPVQPAYGQPAYGQPQYGAPATMPGNVGNGWQQMAQGAVAGLISAIAYGPSNNTSTTTFPNYGDPVDAIRGNIVQERVDNVLW